MYLVLKFKLEGVMQTISVYLCTFMLCVCVLCMGLEKEIVNL